MTIFLKFLQFCFRIIFFAPAGIALSLMYFCGWITQAIAKKTRIKRMAMKDIRMVLPQSQAEQIAEKLIRNISYSIFEVLCIPFFRKKHYASVFKWKGLENLEQALAQGKGAMILTMHAGNYEAVTPALSNQGYPVNAVLRATRDPVFEIVNRSRSAGGAKLINILDEDMYKESTKALARNEVVLLLADTGALESRHAYRKFLGKEVPVATGWLTLAQRAECPVIPTLARREGRTNLITLYEPFRVTRENREQIMQRTGKIFENFIRENPDHWAIFLNPYETQRMVKGQ
jgi:KDO2-lipid IV(A) lauroyltransferase